MSTIHFIEKINHLKSTGVVGILESHCWVMTEQERKAEYLALHRSKSKKSHRYGKIINVTPSNEEEGRWVVTFQMIEERVKWAGNQSHGMAYKSLS